MERVKTGIPGLDEIMNGGVPKGQLVLLSGTCGTGKTTICGQYVYQGLTKFGENGIFLSFEDMPDNVKKNLKRFGWDFEPFEKQNRFDFVRYDPYHIEEVFDILESNVREIKARRIVIDSVSALGLHVRDKAELRRMIFNLSNLLRKLDCTVIMVSEIVPGSAGISRYGVEEFVTDSVVVLYYERNEFTFTRAMQVWKMSGSDHSKKLHPYKITNKGIVVQPGEEAFMRRK
ncbi:MAG: AAA family ATPase [Candidatus Aenigmarchaeota archaeon]|nr:AAA family ATPase [Candidatus Aenigmarchaeota archaeon]NIP40345.1 AAA family ATPase [Candidatus Aenigmarchaeota archaeon]NIQ17839.1 AAA family ATPase [Candidatus Aenigmarchaeota archaeon]NIS73220.1 AAA family ATPase [Candidatus Aenigmarchaeota archaeon]